QRAGRDRRGTSSAATTRPITGHTSTPSPWPVSDVAVEFLPRRWTPIVCRRFGATHRHRRSRYRRTSATRTDGRRTGPAGRPIPGSPRSHCAARRLPGLAQRVRHPPTRADPEPLYRGHHLRLPLADCPVVHRLTPPPGPPRTSPPPDRPRPTVGMV